MPQDKQVAVSSMTTWTRQKYNAILLYYCKPRSLWISYYMLILLSTVGGFFGAPAL